MNDALASAIDFSNPEPNLRGIPLWMARNPLDQETVAFITEAHRRGRIMSRLRHFAPAVAGFVPARHHELICDGVDALLDDEYDVLVVMSPPASAKSSYISKAAPAYIIGKNPETRIISVSRGAELATEFGGSVKNIVESAEFISLTGVTLASDTRAKDNWKTTVGGGYFAVGASGGVLGKRADIVICLVGTTQVCTKLGYTPISEIEIGDEVLAYDTEKFSTRYCRVIDTGWRETDDIYRIHTADGRVVESTGNHPFFVDGVFVPAMALAVGDVLLSAVRQPVHDQCAGDGQTRQAGENGLLLRPPLRDPLHECPARIEDAPDVQQLWEAIHEQGTRSARRAGLLGGVQAGDAPESGDEAAGQQDSRIMPALRQDVLEEEQDQRVLLDRVQECSAQSEDVGCGKPMLAGRIGQESLQGWREPAVQGGAENCDVSGQSGVRDLRQHGELAGSPCGHERAEQHSRQHCDVVQTMSHETARCGSGETFKTTVARIERIRRNEKVFDLRIEGTRNFFANDILVHNCDDIHASFEDAQSETQLQKIRNWFESDLLSRLTPQGKLIVIGQRLNANDIIGFVMQRALENPAIRLKVLKFPAVAPDGATPETDILGRYAGERMWPEFYTDAYLDDKRRDDFIWRTLWMQEPPSEDGSWVGADDIRIVDIVPDIPSMSIYLLTDLALSVNKGDYSVHIVVGVTADGRIFILHAWRDRCAIEVTVARHLDLADEYKPVESLIDDDNAAKVYVQLLASEARTRRVFVPWRTLPMRGQDKETRNAPLRGLFRNGRIVFRRAQWNDWLVREIMIFPNAMGSGVDDGVDALGLIGRRLIGLSRPTGEPEPAPKAPDLLHMTLDGLYDERDRLNNCFSRRRI